MNPLAFYQNVNRARVFDEFEAFIRHPLQVLHELEREESKTAHAKRMTVSADVDETERHFLMSLDLPGIKKEDVNIECKDSCLVISGERKKSITQGQRRERSFGRFERSFNLPDSVDVNQIEAHFEDGVLQVYLPKKQESEPKKIKIQYGEGKGIFAQIGQSVREAEDRKDQMTTRTHSVAQST